MFGLQNKIFSVFAVMSMVVAGCSAADSSGSTEPPAQTEESASTKEALQPNMPSSNCNCSSTFTCPKNGYQVEYFAAGCGYPSYSQAGADCRNHCGGTTCRLGSWTCP